MKNQENRNRRMNSVTNSMKCENPYLFYNPMRPKNLKVSSQNQIT